MTQKEIFESLLNDSPHIVGYAEDVDEGYIILDAMREDMSDCSEVRIYFDNLGRIKEFITVD